MIFLKLAWRNLWRNKRRTLITLGSVFFAVVLSTLMMSLKEGFYTNMIDAMVSNYTGYAQIQASGYREDKTIDNSLFFNDTLKNELSSSKELSSYLPRVESFAMAASEKVTKGAMVIGIDPEKEARSIELDKNVVEGSYLQSSDQAIMVGEKLADYLKIKKGDTLVLLGQGYHGVSAAGKYPVKGIIKFGSPELSKQVVFLPLKEAQWLYDVQGMVTNIILFPEDPMNTKRVVTNLRNQLNDQYEVLTWQELNPELIKMIETDRVEGYVFMFILYMVIAFGMFGTAVMMIAERQHEFGIMVAIGMKRIRLSVIVFTEIVVISLFGAFTGMLGAFPICLYFNLFPISLGEEVAKLTEEYGFEFLMQPSIAPEIFVQQASIILFIAIIISIYPVIQILRINAVKAMRS